MLPAEFHPATRSWFSTAFPAPTPAQEAAWPLIKNGRHVLIAAPTGSGKTLAAFLACIDDLVHRDQGGGLDDGVQVLYVSPLKALSADIRVNLEAPLAGIAGELPLGGTLRAAVRTGDTSPAERDRMRRTPPHILVTTPESLFILLTSVAGRKMLSGVRQVIVDEIHALAGSKRGSHLLLSLARLDALAERPAQRIGLSATQKPMDAMAHFLCHEAPCKMVNAGHHRERDLSLWVPPSPLTAIMANEVWEEVYDHLAGLIDEHHTTLIFVNTRRLTERATKHLADRLGEEAVMAHHGSLAKEHRHKAEKALKAGRLKAMVATASLELGIDIGDVDLVVQLGSPGSIAGFLQRVGRSGHAVGATPKGILMPLSLDDLAECTALLGSVADGELDRIRIPEGPLDVLAQHIVAEVAGQPWAAEDLLKQFQTCSAYGDLRPEAYENVLEMLANGYATARGRRGAYLHYDRVGGELRPRRGARLTALMNSGTIPDLFDYQVVLRPADIPVGTLNEDFAFESLPGDIFQLGNLSYRILKVETGRVFVEDARGQPPNLPFWIGEAPGRTDELSEAVSALRQKADRRLSDQGVLALREWLTGHYGLAEYPAAQLADFLDTAHAALGLLPTRETLVLERFFDEVGDMHLVVHSPYGSRLNRALGLSLRKRFCRKFNFELQASALEDTLILSLGPTHSFDMGEVLGYLNAATVRDVLIQALLDAPMFPTHFRWNASIALAVKRMAAGKKRPPQFQRSDAEDLMAVVFPDQLACLENIAGPREVPDHPLVAQTLTDCLTDVMDIDGLEALLRSLASGEVRVETRDLAHPSPLAESVINARPYAFLDDGEAEERRTRAVRTRPNLTAADAADLSRLSQQAVRRVMDEIRLEVRDADELHDAILVAGVVRASELAELCAVPLRLGNLNDPAECSWVHNLREAGRLLNLDGLWVARERLAEACAAYAISNPPLAPLTTVPEPEAGRADLLRSVMEVTGPISEPALAERMRFSQADLGLALLQLEQEGVLIKGPFFGDEQLWCHRRLLARIQRYGLKQRRDGVRPVTLAGFNRFLLRWQQLAEPEGRGEAALSAVLDRFEGCAAPPAELERVLGGRMDHYQPGWLDQLTRSGRFSWLRLEPSGHRLVGGTPIALVRRRNLSLWLTPTAESPDLSDLGAEAGKVFHVLEDRGACFADELLDAVRLTEASLESALAELVAAGRVTSDSFVGARYLSLSQRERRRRDRHRAGGLPVVGLEEAGRWSLLPRPPADEDWRWRRTEGLADALLRRYGVVFRGLVRGIPGLPPWGDLQYVLRRRELREDVAGGRFVDGVTGEQFALPEAVTMLKQVREGDGSFVVISACDPLNLSGRVYLTDQRIAAAAGNRLALVNGKAVGALTAGELIGLGGETLSAPVRDALTRGPGTYPTPAVPCTQVDAVRYSSP
ncbi:MAG: DEAD/DEAH box helicase [Pseudomonadota bacterium]